MCIGTNKTKAMGDFSLNILNIAKTTCKDTNGDMRSTRLHLPQATIGKTKAQEPRSAHQDQSALAFGVHLHVVSTREL